MELNRLQIRTVGYVEFAILSSQRRSNEACLSNENCLQWCQTVKRKDTCVVETECTYHQTLQMRHMTQYQLIHSRCVVTIVTNRQRRQSQRSWNNIRWLQPIVFYLVLYSSQHTQTLTLRFDERFQRICIYSSIILYKLDSSHSMNTCRRNRTNPSEYPISEDSEYLLSSTQYTSTHYLHYTEIMEITLPSCHRYQWLQI